MSDKLPVMEIFPSFQGEGAHSGKAAWFVRLQGCDVGCHWCDVKESWEMDVDKNMAIDDIISQLQDLPIDLVIITGGEPCLYDLSELTMKLHDQNYSVHLETSGTQPIMGDFDWICVSPKKFKECLPENIKKADELKIIVYNSSDFDWAVDCAEGLPDKSMRYLQPEWSRREEMVPQIFDYIQNHPQWYLSLQSHKYVDMP